MRVRVVCHEHWANSASGTIGRPPAETGTDWDGCRRLICTDLGVIALWWVWFDQPQSHAEGPHLGAPVSDVNLIPIE